MTRWIALLRGVNVGGNKKLPMAEFRALLSELGYDDVATYIQSGNAVFSGGNGAAQESARIEAAIEAKFGFHTDTFVMPVARLSDAIGLNPYPNASDDPKTLHLIFLEKPQQDLDETAMRALLREGQDFHLGDGVFYLYAPDGYSKCPLAEKLPRFINGSMTARNLRSCMKIAELAAQP